MYSDDAPPEREATAMIALHNAMTDGMVALGLYKRQDNGEEEAFICIVIQEGRRVVSVPVARFLTEDETNNFLNTYHVGAGHAGLPPQSRKPVVGNLFENVVVGTPEEDA